MQCASQSNRAGCMNRLHCETGYFAWVPMLSSTHLHLLLLQKIILSTNRLPPRRKSSCWASGHQIQKRTGKPHISQNFFRSWNLFHNENRVTSCFTTTSELARLCSDQMFISDHFHSGFVKHLAADSSQFLGQTSKVNCESFSIIVSACALFGCALNTEAKTMFFLNQWCSPWLLEFGIYWRLSMDMSVLVTLVAAVHYFYMHSCRLTPSWSDHLGGSKGLVNYIHA